MAGPGNIFGSPSQRGSGVIDLRRFAELEARITKLEAALNNGLRLVIGEVKLEWAGGTNESKTVKAPTGLDATKRWIYLAAGQPNGINAYFLEITGSGTEIQVTAIAGAAGTLPPPANTKASVWFMGIGE